MSVLDSPLRVPTHDSTGSVWRALALTVTLALVAFAILLPVMQSSDETAQGYRLHALEQQREDLEAKIYVTQSDIAQLGSAARIDNEARNRLGMVPADREMKLAVTVPPPAGHALPARYVTPTTSAAGSPSPTLWQRLQLLVAFH